MARQCLLIQDHQSNDSFTLEQLDPHEELKGHSEPMEWTISIPLREDDPTKTIHIGSLLDQVTKAKLISFLRDNADVFAWSAADMLGIPMEVITHHLQADPSVKPIKQKKRNFALERQRAINEEVKNLLNAKLIKEV